MPGGDTGPGGSIRTRRARALILTGTVLLASLLSGCFNTLFPAGEEAETREELGLLRVWIATSPGAIGAEFAHYNVSFGPAFAYTDVHLSGYVAMESRTPTLDFVRMEREKLTAPLAEAFTPEGEYHGVATSVTRASVAVDRIVGTVNGEPTTRADERPIESREGPSSYRAKIIVIGGRTTDVFLETDLQRSLQRGDGGNLKHTTILTRITVLVDGNLASQMAYDGGKSTLEPNDPLYAEFERQRQIPLSEPPSARFRVFDAETEKQMYSNFASSPTKRLRGSVGLGQDLVLDATQSHSNYQRSGVALPIIEYVWDFGDGTTAKGARVTKNFTAGGIYDLVLTIRDEAQLVGTDHLTLFVPYTTEQAVRSDEASAGGTFGLPASDNTVPGMDGRAQHVFQFPEELEDGQLRVGAYRVTVTANDPLGGAYLGLQDVAVSATSGHFTTHATGAGPWLFAGAAVPAWRGPLPAWVTGTLVVDLELSSGLLVDYDILVEPLYYHNLSRGVDPHATHIHSPWTLGPGWGHLDWDGTLRRE